MKTVEKLIKATSDKKVGNHRKKVVNAKTTFYYYFTTVICRVDNATKTFSTSYGVWRTKSTTQAINSYIRGLTALGYIHLQRT